MEIHMHTGSQGCLGALKNQPNSSGIGGICTNVVSPTHTQTWANNSHVLDLVAFQQHRKGFYNCQSMTFVHHVTVFTWHMRNSNHCLSSTIKGLLITIGAGEVQLNNIINWIIQYSFKFKFHLHENALVWLWKNNSCAHVLLHSTCLFMPIVKGFHSL